MSDTALDEAKKDALDKPVGDLTVEEAVEEDLEPVVGDDALAEDFEEHEDIDDALPQDHKERSNLGRTLSALFKKTDKQDEVMSRMWDIMESDRAKNSPVEPNYEDEVPMTRGDFKKIKQAEQQVNAKYERSFQEAFNTMSKGYSEEDVKEIEKIFYKSYNTVESENGTLDGAKAFQQASKDFYGKKTPLKRKRAQGVITKQKTKTRGKPLAKLDRATQSYMNSVRRDRGEEAADRLHKEL